MNKMTLAVFLRLWTSIRQYRRYLLLTLLTMLATAMTEVMFPHVFGYLLDHGFKGEKTDLPLWKVPTAIVGIFVLHLYFHYQLSDDLDIDAPAERSSCADLCQDHERAGALLSFRIERSHH